MICKGEERKKKEERNKLFSLSSGPADINKLACHA